MSWSLECVFHTFFRVYIFLAVARSLLNNFLKTSEMAPPNGPRVFLEKKCSSCHEACHFLVCITLCILGFAGTLPGLIVTEGGDGLFENCHCCFSTSLHRGWPSCPLTPSQCICRQTRCHNSKPMMFLWKQRWTGRTGCARHLTDCPCP